MFISGVRMLPYISKVKFGYIIPLAVKGTQTAFVKRGINVFVAENGNGKTTFLDLIERSICSDAHAERYFSFSHKRSSPDAFIESEWIFNHPVTILQKLTDAGVRTSLLVPGSRLKHYTKPEYSHFLLKEIGLSLDEFQELFEGLYYKRENDLGLMGKNNGSILPLLELLSKITLKETPEVLQIRGAVRQLETEIRLLNKEKKALLDNLSEIQAILSERMQKGENREDLLRKKLELSRELNELTNELDEKKKDLRRVNQEHSAVVDNLNNISDELREYTRMREQYKKEKEFLNYQLELLEQEMEDVENGVVISSYEEYLKKNPYCPLCYSNLKNRAKERIKHGCPVCGTPWEELPSKIRQQLTQASLIDTEKTKSEIEQKIEKLREQIVSKTENIKKVERKIEEIQAIQSNLRTDMVSLAKKRLNIEEEIFALNKKIRGLEQELNDVQTKLKIIEERMNSPLIKEKLALIENTLKEKETEKKKLIGKLPEKRDIQDILSRFSKITKSVFGYPLLVEPETGVITIGANKTIRPFDSMSWGEKYLTDTCFRIAVWEHLLELGAAEQGLIMLDSPEAALDEKRLKLLGELVSEHSTRITFIITTRISAFPEVVGGNELFVKRTGQTSLFDFIN